MTPLNVIEIPEEDGKVCWMITESYDKDRIWWEVLNQGWLVAQAYTRSDGQTFKVLKRQEEIPDNVLAQLPEDVRKVI